MIDEVTSISMDRKYLWRSHKDTYSCDVTFVNSSLTNLQYYGVTFVNSSVTKLYDANNMWKWLAICETVAKSVTRSIAASHLRFLKFCLKKVLKKLFPNVFIITNLKSILPFFYLCLAPAVNKMCVGSGAEETLAPVWIFKFNFSSF